MASHKDTHTTDTVVKKGESKMYFINFILGTLGLMFMLFLCLAIIKDRVD